MNLSRSCLVLVALVAGATTPAGALEVTGGFTGWWGQPEQQSHGVIITISRLPGGDKTGVVYWAHYDAGEPSWLFAQGDIDGDTIDAAVYRFDGISFMQPHDPDAEFGEQIGTMQVRFSDCVNGTVSFDTATLGAGEFQIARLDNPPGRSCTGGMADDRRPDRARERIEVALTGQGSGFAELDMRPGRASFEVDARGLPAGNYTLLIGDEPRGEFEVLETAAGATFGKIEFRSPQTGSFALLDFDPRGKLIAVLDADVTVMSATLPEAGNFPGNASAPFDMPVSGGRSIEFDLDNLGPYPDAIARAGLTMGGGRMEFEIEMAGVPAGSYPVFVLGSERGVVEVVDDGTGMFFGEIEFGYPEDEGQRPFDFDPAGAMIEIFDGADSSLLFQGVFPEFHMGGGGGCMGCGGGPGSGPGHGGTALDETGVQFDNVGGPSYSGARAWAEFVERFNRVDFEVEVESMPSGNYPFFVDGLQRGVIGVFGDGDGEIEFGDPARFDEELLEFDPRGKRLEIRDADGVVFSVMFP